MQTKTNKNENETEKKSFSGEYTSMSVKVAYS